MGLGEKD
ncbi:hypothetical protein CP061683_0799A, partial [Chlamydia psittaci 06-1683]